MVKRTTEFTDFRPIHIRLDRVGPFRSPFELSFIDHPSNGETGQPCNMYMFVSKNGHGKTTLLESIFWVMSAIGLPHTGIEEFSNIQSLPKESLIDDIGRAQVDFRAVVTVGSISRRVVISFCLGGDEPLRVLTPSMLSDVQADQWIPFVCGKSDWKRGYRLYGDHDKDLELLESIRASVQHGLGLGDLLGEEILLPSVVYFPAGRGITVPNEMTRSIVRPRDYKYKPAYWFGSNGDDWSNSLDGLLVWLEWIGEGKFNRAAELANRLVFANRQKTLSRVDRNRLTAMIKTEEGEHSVDQLSHGEKSLLEIVLRSSCHMTGAAIVLIDELDVHLHPKWQHSLLTLLKSWVKERSCLTVIASTHQPEIIKSFAVEHPEIGLTKGGYVIDKDEL